MSTPTASAPVPATAAGKAGPAPAGPAVAQQQAEAVQDTADKGDAGVGPVESTAAVAEGDHVDVTV